MVDYYGYTITDILNQWADFGVFAYLLPFLMIFAVVFGIMSKTKLLGENRGVQATIALAVGLLALQFDYVSNFFAAIFPYTGIGIAVLLVALIFLGLIVDTENKKVAWVWVVIGAIIAIAVVLSAFTDYAWWGGGAYGLAYAWPAVLAGIIILVLLAWVIFGGKKNGGGR